MDGLFDLLFAVVACALTWVGMAFIAAFIGG